MQNFVKLCCAGGDDIPTAGANVMDGLRSVQGTFKKIDENTKVKIMFYISCRCG